MAEITLHLFGGEQDGYRTNIDLRGDTPEMFYIWRASDSEKISSANGKKRMVLADKLAVLAYRHDEAASHESELRYVRHAEADKELADPAL